MNTSKHSNKKNKRTVDVPQKNKNDEPVFYSEQLQECLWCVSQMAADLYLLRPKSCEQFLAELNMLNSYAKQARNLTQENP